MLKCNNAIRSEFNIKIEIEKCTIFLTSVSRLLSHEKGTALSDGFPLQT